MNKHPSKFPPLQVSQLTKTSRFKCSGVGGKQGVIP